MNDQPESERADNDATEASDLERLVRAVTSLRELIECKKHEAYQDSREARIRAEVYDEIHTEMYDLVNTKRP